MPTTLFFPAAIEIDNEPLTDQGRSPVSVARDERSVINELANGTRKKYVKKVAKTFSMSWSWLPDSSDATIDGGMGRTALNETFATSGDTHLLKFYDRNGGWEEFTVFVSSYSEELIRRNPHDGTHFWEISLEFEEQ